MSRIAVLVVIAVASVAGVVACSKSAGSQSEPNSSVQPGATTAGAPAAAVGFEAPGGGAPRQVSGGGGGGGGSGAIDPQLRLHAEEGTLAIVAPSDAKAGTEAVAKITLTPTAAYHVNMDFPIKLVLEPQANVALAKPELHAGGSVKQGDAEALDERQLVFAIKVTASQSGTYTINGSFKFAVCNETQCLPKKEPIAIQIAAK